MAVQMTKSIEQRNIEIFPTITERVNKLYDAYLLDLDGTVLLGNNLIPGAEKVIKMLRDLDKRVIFISNNSTSSASSYADKLTSLGVPTQNYDVINSSQVLINFLNKNLPQGRLLVLGEPELCGDLESNGFHSNGFSLIRKILDDKKINLNNKTPYNSIKKKLGDDLLLPTKIYTQIMLPLIIL